MKKLSLVFGVLFLIVFATQVFAAGELGLGVIGDDPVLRYIFTDKFKGDLGITIGSELGKSTFGILVRGDIEIAKAGGTSLYIPLVLEYISIQDRKGASGFNLMGGFGVETYIKKNLSVGFDAYAISIFSPQEGDSETNICGSGRVMAHYYF